MVSATIQIVLIVSNEYTKSYSRVDLLSFAHIDRRLFSDKDIIILLEYI